MTNIETINQVLADFGKSISLPSLSLDMEKTCTLQFDGNQSVQIVYDEQLETLKFFTQVGTLPENETLRCCDCLLKSNSEWTLTQGSTLSKRENANTILLGYQVPTQNISTKIFEKTLKVFLQQIDKWKDFILQMEQGGLPEALAEL